MSLHATSPLRKTVGLMTAEQRLAKIAKVFDRTRHGNDGLNISTHAYWNLQGAIIDIERTGKCNAVCLRTLKRVRDQLRRIDRLLPRS
jgi:hypothetical protein